MRSDRVWRRNTQKTSSTASPACAASTTSTTCSTGVAARARSWFGSPNGATSSPGKSASSTRHSTMATTATLASDLPASTRLSGPSNRFNPAFGLMREKSIRNALPLRRKRVCTSTTAMPATIAASTNGAAPSQQARPGEAGHRRVGPQFVCPSQENAEPQRQIVHGARSRHDQRQRDSRQPGEVGQFARDRGLALFACLLLASRGCGFSPVFML